MVSYKVRTTKVVMKFHFCKQLTVLNFQARYCSRRCSKFTGANNFAKIILCIRSLGYFSLFSEINLIFYYEKY